MSVEVIEKELLFTLSGPEILEIRKTISSCEAKIAVLNEEIIKNLEQCPPDLEVVLIDGERGVYYPLKGITNQCLSLPRK